MSEGSTPNDDGIPDENLFSWIDSPPPNQTSAVQLENLFDDLISDGLRPKKKSVSVASLLQSGMARLCRTAGDRQQSSGTGAPAAAKRSHECHHAAAAGAEASTSGPAPVQGSVDGDTQAVSKRSRSEPFLMVTRTELRAFFNLCSTNATVNDFLTRDSCHLVSDKWLLAITFVYFKRAELSIAEYNPENFFYALYLANDMEEDDDEWKFEIFPWALGRDWRKKYKSFLNDRGRFLARMSYRGAIMEAERDVWLWKRERPLHHGGAVRDYMKPPSEQLVPRGPYSSPRMCTECQELNDSAFLGCPTPSWFINDCVASDAVLGTSFSGSRQEE